jgi:acyl transferase domain-containing protein
LQAQASRLLAALEETTDLADLAYTLQVGREGLEVRAGAVVASLVEARTVLASIAAGEPHDGVLRGQAQDRREALSRLGGADTAAQALMGQATSGDVHALLSAWVSGVDVPWWSLRRAGDVRMLRLPGYAFARDRYWLPDMYESEPGPGGEAMSEVVDVAATAAALHPLVHVNTSDFAEICFSTGFRGDEPHLVRGVDARPRLSVWTALEMARIAHGFASGQALETASFEDLVFAAPPLLGTPKTVSIGLYPRETTSDFELFSLADDGDRIVHAQGTLRPGVASESAPLVLDGFVPERDDEDADGLRIQHWRGADGTSLLKLRFAGPTGRDDALVDPVRLEQLLRAITGIAAPRLRAIARLVVLAAPTRSVWVRTATTADGLAVTCWNETRQPCLHVEGLRVAAHAAHTSAPRAATPDDRGLRLLTEYQKGRLSRAEIERCIAQGWVA